MIYAVTILVGLPPYGPRAISFPAKFGAIGREGTVVEFQSDTGTWVGNFAPGYGDLQYAAVHPNGVDALVIAGGELWHVDGLSRAAAQLMSGLTAMFAVRDPAGWIFSSDLALARYAADGIRWHTRRISWDGFGQLSVDRDAVTGFAWPAIDEDWYPFSVDVRTGKVTGGGYFEEDIEGWERLCPPAGP